MQSVSYSQVVMVRVCTTHNDPVDARSDVSVEDAMYRMEGFALPCEPPSERV